MSETLRAQRSSYRPSAPAVIGDVVAPLRVVEALEDPYRDAVTTDPAPAIEPPAPCVHGAPPGTSCIYCELAPGFAHIPPALDTTSERALARLLHQLVRQARAEWNSSTRARWRGRWDPYLTAYLARRLTTLNAVTVDVPDV